MNFTSVHLDDSRCTDLVLELLPFADRSAAIEHAAQCVVCAERLRRHVSAHEGWRTASGAARTQQRVDTRWWWGGAAAAALIAVLVIPRGGLVPDPHRSATRLTPPSEGVLTREGESEDPHLRAGFQAYSEGDLSLAEAELLKAEVRGATAQARDLYLAQTKMLRGDTSGALSLLRSLRWELIPLHVQHDAVALYAQALRLSGRPASADSVEHALEQTPEWLPFRP